MPAQAQVTEMRGHLVPVDPGGGELEHCVESTPGKVTGTQ